MMLTAILSFTMGTGSHQTLRMTSRSIPGGCGYHAANGADLGALIVGAPNIRYPALVPVLPPPCTGGDGGTCSGRCW